MYLSLRTRPATTPSRGRALRRPVGRTVFVLGMVSLVTDVSTESVNAALPNYLIAIIGLTPQAFGVVNGLYNGVSALVRLLAGYTADRTDRPKWVAFAGYVVSGLSKFFLLSAHGLAAFSGIATADQVGKGLRTAPRDAMIAAAAPVDGVGRAFGVHRALDTFGAFLGPLMAFWILSVVPNDYHSVFVAAAAFAVIGWAMMLLLVPDMRPRRAAPAERVQVPLKLLADRRLARIAAAAGLLGLLTVGETYVFLQLQFTDDLAMKYFPLLIVGMNLAYLILAVPMGRLADRIGRAPVFIAGHIALVLAYLGGGGPLHNTAVTIACLALLGVYYAATDGVLAAMASRATDASVRTSAIALAQTVAAAAMFFASLGFATLWATIGRGTALLVVAVGLAVVLPIAALLLRDRPTANREVTG